MPSDVQHAPPDRYFHHERAEMLRYVPINAIRILEVGCGAGAFGGVLRARQQHAAQSAVQLIGIEFDIESAETERKTFDEPLYWPNKVLAKTLT